MLNSKQNYKQKKKHLELKKGSERQDGNVRNVPNFRKINLMRSYRMLEVYQVCILIAMWLGYVFAEVWNYTKGKVVKLNFKQFFDADSKSVTDDVVKPLDG